MSHILATIRSDRKNTKRPLHKAIALAAGHLTLDALTVRRPQSQVVPEKLHDERRVLQFQRSHKATQHAERTYHRYHFPLVFQIICRLSPNMKSHRYERATFLWFECCNHYDMRENLTHRALSPSHSHHKPQLPEKHMKAE